MQQDLTCCESNIFLLGCGDAIEETCEGKLDFETMVEPLPQEETFGANSKFRLVYSGIYSAACKRMFYRGSGAYTFKFDVRARPNPAHVRRIQLADGRALDWDQGEWPSLEAGSIKYSRPVSYGQKSDRHLLLPWTPVPQRLTLDIDYPVKPDLEFFPLSVSYSYRLGDP
jgi:hypothetical protein